MRGRASVEFEDRPGFVTAAHNHSLYLMPDAQANIKMNTSVTLLKVTKE